MSGLIDVVLPADQVEGTRSQVQRWLKAVGEATRRDEPLVEIETDKVTVEVPAPADGVLAEIVAPEGTDVAPGALLARLQAGTTAADIPPSTRAPVAAAGVAPKPAGRPPGASHAMIPLSPAVRRLLAERGLSVESVQGSGEGGRITVEDVLAAAPGGAAPAAARRACADGRGTAARAAHAHAAAHCRAHGGKPAAHRAARHDHAPGRMSAVIVDRAKRKAGWTTGKPLTLTAYFVAACVAAIGEVPEANARWTADAILVHERIDIGIGTALPERGLVVPVIRDAGRLDLAGIAGALGVLVQKARNDALTPADLQGGTFTISNHGVSGSLVAAPIVINQPQSAILGVGKLEKRAIVVSEGGEDRIVIRPCCYVTLTIDHRVLDGHQANRFMETLVRRLETWA